MKKTMMYFIGVFTGLYEWGKGWKDLDTLNKWNTFWRKYKGIYWKFFETNDSWCNTQYLVCIGSSVYLHPMDFNGTLCSCGVTCNGNNFDGEIRELINACEECAKYCGGTFKLVKSEEISVDFGKIA